MAGAPQRGWSVEMVNFMIGIRGSYAETAALTALGVSEAGVAHLMAALVTVFYRTEWADPADSDINSSRHCVVPCKRPSPCYISVPSPVLASPRFSHSLVRGACLLRSCQALVLGLSHGSDSTRFVVELELR